MSIEVYINDEIVELKDDKGIATTFQIGSIFNPGNRAGNSTNKFKLPKTKNNTRILGFLLNINSATNIPYQKNNAKIIQNGVPIVPSGFGIIDSTGKDYQLTIYSGNVNPFDLIKGRNVNQMNWSSSNHNFDIPTIIAANTNNSDYIYAMVDWGKGLQLLDNTTLQNSNALIPILRTARVLEKMFLEIGYELKGTFLDYDQYERLIHCINQFGYLDDAINRTTGFVDDVDVVSQIIQIEGSCFASGPEVISNIPLKYQNQQGQSFGTGLFTHRFTPDNYYLGTFNLNARGLFQGYLPKKGEKILNNGNKDYKECNINDTHVSWISNRPGNSEQLIFVYDIESNGSNLVQVTANGTGGSSNGRLSMSEDSGGYLAWSVVVSGRTQVSIYEIATATTTLIYDNFGGSGTVDKLKVYNGKVAWMDSQAGGGFKIYDIQTATVQVISSLLSIGGIWDHNGDYVVWEEPAGNDIFEYNYATDTNTLIDNGGAFSGMSTLIVLGDYATYWDTSLDKFVSYKLSTQTNTTAKADASGFSRNQARTLTKVSWTDSSGDLMYYDLLTDTLTNTAVNNATVPAISQVDRFISMNDDNIAYISNAQDDIDVYNITSTSVTNVDSNVENHNWVIIGKSNIITYHQIGTSDIIRMYDLTASSFFPNIINSVNMVCFKKALNSDRMVFTNDMGLSSSPLDRVSIIEPVINPIEANLNLVIKEDGIVVYSQSINKTDTFSDNFNMLINTGVVYVKSGSNYDAELSWDADRDETIPYNIIFNLILSSYSFSATNTIPYKAKLEMKNFYNVAQEEVLKDVLNAYSLTMQTNDLTKQVFLNPLDDLEKNKALMTDDDDWSELIDLNTIPNSKYKIGRYAQVNNLIYTPDDDVPADTGKGSFNINDTSLPQEKDIIKLFSVASVGDLRLLNKHTPTIPFSTQPGGFFTEKKSRMLLLDQGDGIIDLKNTQTPDTGQANGDIPYCYFEKEGKDDSLDFTHLIAENYNVLIGMMNQVKVINAKILLSEKRINNLDFTIPKYVDIHNPEFHANGYFYINIISNFKEGSPTSIQLIRL